MSEKDTDRFINESIKQTPEGSGTQQEVKPEETGTDPQPKPEEKPKVEETPKVEEKPKEEVAPPVEETPKPQEEDANYWKGKFGNSTSENQRITGEYKDLEKVMGEITKEDIPTDEEMRQHPLGANWDSLSEFEQDMARRQVVVERKQNATIAQITKTRLNTETANKVNGIIATRPELRGFEQEFIEYASDPIRRDTPEDDLVGAFMYGKTPKEEKKPEEVKKTETPALERGGGAGADPQNNTTETKLSDDEAEKLRKSDPKKYMEMVRKKQL